jgi:hypothetical protein
MTYLEELVEKIAMLIAEAKGTARTEGKTKAVELLEAMENLGLELEEVV